MGEINRWTDQEADRLTRIMVDNPHQAAEEMRQQLQQLDPRGATMLIAKTKNLEYEGGLGDLQIQVELDQNGCDSGYRNVTMATPDGIEQIAELRSSASDRACQQQNSDYDPAYDSRYQGGYRPQVVDPLSVVAGIIVGDLLWNQRRGVDFGDDRYRDWCDRERFRENNYMSHRDEFRQNWQDRDFRQQFQTQDWRQNAWSQGHNYFNNPMRPHHDQDRPRWQDQNQNQDQRRWQDQRQGGDFQNNGGRNPNINQGMDQNAMRQLQLERQGELQREQIAAQQRARDAQVQQQHDLILQQQQQRDQMQHHPQTRLPQVQVPVPVPVPNQEQQWQHRQPVPQGQPTQQWQQGQQGRGDQDHDHKRRDGRN